LGPETSSGVSESREPLFINRPNTWAKRPDCISRVPKLYLAADYVRTHADLACMECASEAAKRTVTAILAITNSRVSGPMIHELGMPFLFKPFRAIDQVRFELGLPWDFDLES
jgi:hypothetical protein